METYDERKRLFERARKIEIDADHLPVARWEKLKKLNKHVIAKQQLVSKQRMIKTDVEVEKMIASQRLNERVLEAITPQIQLGMTERDLEQVIRTEILHQ